MAVSKVVGVDVVVKTGAGPTAILGQRGASMTVKTDMIDMSVKADAWAKVFQAGWYEWSIDCDGLLYAGGAGGIGTLVTAQLARTAVAVEVTIGSSGEKFTGSAIYENLSGDGPHEKEATFKATLRGTGTLTPAVGS